MSDQPTPAGYPVEPMPDVHTWIPAAEPEKLYCQHPGCNFNTTSPAGLRRHTTIQHDRKKKKTVKVTTAQTYGKKPPIPSGQGLKEVWYDGNGRVLLTDRNGGWWVAKQIVV